jgi:hypothetical protein
MKIIDYSELTPELAAQGCMVNGMSNDAYHAYDGISKSGLDLVARSPAHYMYGEKKEKTRPMVIGSAIHCAVFEPELFVKDYMLLRDIKVRTATEYKQAIKTISEDLVLIQPESDYVSGMQNGINNNKHAKELLDMPRWSEIACFATDPVTGVLVKCKFDTLLESLIAVDLKKTQDASTVQFEKSVGSYRYHVQHAFYSDVFEWATGIKLEAFRFLAVEERMPHFSKLHECDTGAINYGRKLYREALNIYAECLEKNDWPMPDGSLGYVGLPYWAADPDLSEDF